MREEEATNALEALGLTGKESRAYLALLHNGVSTAQQVSALLDVQYPAVYRILQSLQTKGWIEVSQERPNRYRARAPRIVAEEARQGGPDAPGGASQLVGPARAAAAPPRRGPGGELAGFQGPGSAPPGKPRGPP